MSTSRHPTAHGLPTPAGLLLALLFTAALLRMAEPAYGHATFSKIGPFPPSTEQQVQLDVPVEPFEFPGQIPDPANFYNEKVETDIPSGFEVVSCAQVAGWDCSFSASQITWVNQSGSSENDKREDFTFKVKTPATPDTYFFTTVQTYNSGCAGKCKAVWDKPGLIVKAAATTTTTPPAATTTTPPAATTTTPPAATTTTPLSRSGGSGSKGDGGSASGSGESDDGGLADTGISGAAMFKVASGALLLTFGGLARRRRRD